MMRKASNPQPSGSRIERGQPMKYTLPPFSCLVGACPPPKMSGGGQAPTKRFILLCDISVKFDKNISGLL